MHGMPKAARRSVGRRHHAIPVIISSHIRQRVSIYLFTMHTCCGQVTIVASCVPPHGMPKTSHARVSVVDNTMLYPSSSPLIYGAAGIYIIYLPCMLWTSRCTLATDPLVVLRRAPVVRAHIRRLGGHHRHGGPGRQRPCVFPRETLPG